MEGGGASEEEVRAWEAWRRASADGHTSVLAPTRGGTLEHVDERRYLHARVYPAVLRACRRHQHYGGGTSAVVFLDAELDAAADDDAAGRADGLAPARQRSHDCLRERCRVRPLRVRVYDTDSGHAHVCVDGVCLTRHSDPAQHRAEALMFDLRDTLYVCDRRPCELHACVDDAGGCEYASVRHDADRAHAVCPLTGRVHTAAPNHVFERTPGRGPLREETGGGGGAGTFPGSLGQRDLYEAVHDVHGQHESLRSGEQYELARRVLHLAANEADEEVRRLIAACEDAHLAAAPAAKRRRSASAARVRAARGAHASWRDTYLSVAIVQLALLLDLRRLRDRVAEDEQHFRHVGVQLDRYANGCAHTHTRPCLAEMHAIVLSEQRQWQESPFVYVDDAAMVQMVLAYARRVVALWFVLVTETDFGREYTAAQRFHQFVECAVHLFRDGYQVSEAVAERVRAARAEDAEAFATVDVLFRLGEPTADSNRGPMVVVPPDAFLAVALPEERVGLDPSEASGGGLSRGTPLQHGPRRQSLTPGFHGQRLVPVYTKGMQCVRDTLDHYAVHPGERVDVGRALRAQAQLRQRIALDGTRNTSRDVGIGRAATPAHAQSATVQSSAQAVTLRSSLTHNAAAARMFGTGSVPTLLGHAPVRASSRRAMPLNSTRARATYGVGGGARVTELAARAPLVAPRRGYLSKLQQALRQAIDSALTRARDPLPPERLHSELPAVETLPHEHPQAFAPLRH